MIVSLHVIKLENVNAPAFLDLDLDPEAERLVIQDRQTLEVYFHGIAQQSMKIRVPTRYAVDDGLLVTLIDDTRKFDAKSIDFVIAKIDVQN